MSLNDTGDRVAIGAYLNAGPGGSIGHVRIHQWNGTTWTQMGVDIDGESGDRYSGSSVSLNSAGDRVAIGAYGASNVRIYQWNSTTWTQMGVEIDNI